MAVSARPPSQDQGCKSIHHLILIIFPKHPPRPLRYRCATHSRRVDGDRGAPPTPSWDSLSCVSPRLVVVGQALSCFLSYDHLLPSVSRSLFTRRTRTYRGSSTQSIRPAVLPPLARLFKTGTLAASRVRLPTSCLEGIYSQHQMRVRPRPPGKTEDCHAHCACSCCPPARPHRPHRSGASYKESHITLCASFSRRHGDRLPQDP